MKGTLIRQKHPKQLDRWHLHCNNWKTRLYEGYILVQVGPELPFTDEYDNTPKFMFDGFKLDINDNCDGLQFEFNQFVANILHVNEIEFTRLLRLNNINVLLNDTKYPYKINYINDVVSS